MKMEVFISCLSIGYVDNENLKKRQRFVKLIIIILFINVIKTRKLPHKVNED